jgi:glycosyltransferase involved in cell wall biosynthesis
LTETARPVPISVVVPARNEASRIEAFLAAIRANNPAEVILVDGSSTDATRDLAHTLVDRIIIDAGTGPGAARQLGAEAASMAWVAFVDVDVDLPPGALRALLDEAIERKLDGLQAGLRSEGAGDYWSEELAWQHNQGRSRGWFGFSCSTILRQSVVDAQFDHRFRSGEDIDLRIRLERAGAALGVSTRTIVTHHFAPGFEFARDQWLADGAGLGRLVRKFGRPALRFVLVPFAAAPYGWIRGWRHPVRHGAFFLAFAAGNFLGLLEGMLDEAIPIESGRRRVTVLAGIGLVSLAPAVGVALLSVLAVLLLYLAGPVGSILLSSAWPPVLTVAGLAAMIGLELARSLPPEHRARRRLDALARPIVIIAVAVIVLSMLRFVGILVG